MKPWTTRAILLSILTAWLLSGAGARSILEDSEELGDDDYQASKRELDLSNTVEDSEEQEGAPENKRALEAEDSGDSDAELDSDGLKGERELGDNMMEKRADMDSEVVLTQSMVVKKDALSKRYYRTFCYYSICARVRYRCYYAHHYHYFSTTIMGTTALTTGIPTTAGDASTTEKQQRPGITVLEFT